MNKLPKHVAIVMDGNGRWAARRNLPRVAGHQAGAKTIKEIIKMAVEKHIEVLTLFAFSSENWGRPKDEVNFLMELFAKTLQRQTRTLHKNNIQLHFIGDCTAFNPELQRRMRAAEVLTANNNGLKLVIAINYSGRWDIIRAAQQLAEQAAAGVLAPHQITAHEFQQQLCLANLPEPDLLIRTSGELRISNFMLWQFAYTELYFTDILWPDFDSNAFEAALHAYANRQRRFGLTGQQILAETITESA
ncbi:MAG: isoprenyl transferase [Coxiellaceae bacterium]|nr:MAG: isoprenyl transferase [Coxiellaceae bacterium]